jgi:hypothetical protein
VVDPTQDADPGRVFAGSRSSGSQPRRPRRRGATAVVITDAQAASSREMSSRIRRYTITMAFRMACFVSMLFVHGGLRWVLLALAVFLPYVAVIAANQADQRASAGRLEQGAPVGSPQLTVGEQVDVIPGDVVGDGPAGPHRARTTEDFANGREYRRG